MTTVVDLKPGDTVLFKLPTRDVPVEVVSVEPTGKLAFGSETNRMMMVTVKGLPKPFKGTIELSETQNLEEA